MRRVVARRVVERRSVVERHRRIRTQTMRGERTGRRALTPAQGLERGRDEGEVKVMTVTRA